MKKCEIHIGFWLENVKRSLEDLGKDGWDNFKIGQEIVNWSYVVQDRDQCETLGNKIMNHQVL
jgi:hypothetical protein